MKKPSKLPPNWQEISNNIKAKANYKCDHCGADPKKNRKIILTVHHKDGDQTNNNDDNLICLCATCHLGTHRTLYEIKKIEQQKRAGQMELFMLCNKIKLLYGTRQNILND